MHQQSWEKRLHAGWEEGQARELDTGVNVMKNHTNHGKDF